MIKIKHVLREANHCVDILAKMGAQGSFHFCLWEDPPSSLSLLLLVDYTSIMFVRAQSFGFFYFFLVSSCLYKKKYNINVTNILFFKKKTNTQYVLLIF